MASLTLNPGPSAWPKFPSVSVAVAGALVAGASDGGLAALVGAAPRVGLGGGLAMAAEVTLDAALGGGFRVTSVVPVPQAAVKAANDVTKAIHR
jgi:hypothetical protein